MSDTENTAAPGTEPKTVTLPAVTKAPIRSGGAVMAFIPNDLDQIWRMAKMAVMGGMAPKSLVEGKDPDEATSACAIAIMAGAELGLTPLMSLRSYAVVNGRPSLWGDGIKAVVRKSGICDYIKTGYDDKGGWCEAKRKDTGEVKRVEFTYVQAKAAGLLDKKGPWSQGFKDMMAERRATFRCLNDLFADVLGGIASGEEAIEDGPLVDVTPDRPSPPTPPSPPPAPPTAPSNPGVSDLSSASSAPPVDRTPAEDMNDDASGVSHPVTGEVMTNTAPSTSMDDYFERLNDELIGHETDIDFLNGWDDAKVEQQFAGNAEALDRAAKLKAQHLARIDGLNRSITETEQGQGTMFEETPFPGDVPLTRAQKIAGTP